VKGGFKKIKNYNKKMNPLSWITKPSEGEEKMAQLFKRMEEEKNWVKHDEKPAKKSALSWISKPSEGEEKMAQLFNRMEEEKRKNRKK
jgi:hypoxanthine phosphoribosyltransferase